MKKLFLITLFFLIYSFSTFADNSHFIDFTKVLNTSKSGAAAQKKLQTKFESETKKFKKLEGDIRKEEAEIISQKKLYPLRNIKKKYLYLEKKWEIYKKTNKLHLTILQNLEIKPDKHY